MRKPITPALVDPAVLRMVHDQVRRHTAFRVEALLPSEIQEKLERLDRVSHALQPRAVLGDS